MQDPAVHFILNRVVANYIRLHKAGIVPAAESYSKCRAEAFACVLAKKIALALFPENRHNSRRSAGNANDLHFPL